MRSVFKYQLPQQDNATIELPLVRWLHVGHQHDTCYVWALVDTDKPPESHGLCVRRTGHPMDGSEGRFIGTIENLHGALVFHVFASK